MNNGEFSFNQNRPSQARPGQWTNNTMNYYYVYEKMALKWNKKRIIN